MELSSLGSRHRASQPPSSLHHHHHPHKQQQHQQQLQKLPDLPKTIGRTGKCPTSPTFVHKKQQCRYPEDPDTIESIRDDEPIKLKHLSKTIGKGQGRWTKKAQMNQYELGNIKSPSTLPHSYFLHTDSGAEYSYAYCEPIVTKLNKSPPDDKPPGIPTSISSNALSKGPSAHLLRALLTKSFRKGGSSAAAVNTEKHTFRTRYGTKENIYEDVYVGTRPKISRSSESINKVPVTEELQFVQKQHDRIMGELNLSIEALLMPSKDETEAMERRREEEEQMEQLEQMQRLHQQQHHHHHVHSDACYMGTALMRPYYPSAGEFDSGISGSSSSGASYSGSVLYRPVTCPPPRHAAVHPNDAPSTSSHSNSSQLGRPPSDPSILFQSSCKMSCCLYGDDQPLSMAGTRLGCNATPIESISEKVNFWNKLGKIYSPGSPKQQSPVNGKLHKFPFNSTPQTNLGSILTYASLHLHSP